MSDHYPSLFLVSGGHKSQWYQVEEDHVDLIAELDTAKINYSDNEGSAVKSSSGSSPRIGGTDKSSERRDEEEQKHLHDSVKMTVDLWQKNKFVHFCATLPQYLKKEFGELLGNKLPTEAVHLLSGNFSRAGKAEVLAMFRESLKVV